MSVDFVNLAININDDIIQCQCQKPKHRTGANRVLSPACPIHLRVTETRRVCPYPVVHVSPDEALCHCTWLNQVLWAGEMAQWVKELATKPKDISSTLRTHKMKVERFASDFYIYMLCHA